MGGRRETRKGDAESLAEHRKASRRIRTIKFHQYDPPGPLVAKDLDPDPFAQGGGAAGSRRSQEGRPAQGTTGALFLEAGAHLKTQFDQGAMQRKGHEGRPEWVALQPGQGHLRYARAAQESRKRRRHRRQQARQGRAALLLWSRFRRRDGVRPRIRINLGHHFQPRRRPEAPQTRGPDRSHGNNVGTGAEPLAEDRRGLIRRVDDEPVKDFLSLGR